MQNIFSVVFVKSRRNVNAITKSNFYSSVHNSFDPALALENYQLGDLFYYVSFTFTAHALHTPPA